MQWEDRIAKSFDRLAETVISAAETYPIPDTQVDSKEAARILKEYRGAGYLLYLSGWMAAMSYASEWARIAGGGALDDEQDKDDAP